MERLVKKVDDEWMVDVDGYVFVSSVVVFRVLMVVGGSMIDVGDWVCLFFFFYIYEVIDCSRMFVCY